MDLLDETIHIIKSVLNVDMPMDRDTHLLGDMPEFDSQAVVSIIITLEEHLGIYIEDDDISAEIFETVGTLVDFLEPKM